MMLLTDKEKQLALGSRWFDRHSWGKVGVGL